MEKIEVGQLFGNFFALTAKKYRPIYAVAREDETKVIQLDSEIVASILEVRSYISEF